MSREVTSAGRLAGRSVFGTIRRRWPWMAVTVLACVAAAGAITVVKPPTYQATALLVVDQRATSPTADLNATVSTGELLAAHYIKMAGSTTVLKRVCADVAGPCSPDAIKKGISLSTVKGTDLLAANVTDRDPHRATLLANALAKELINEERAEIAAALAPTKTYLAGELSSLNTKMLAATTPAELAALQNQYATAYARQENILETETRLDGQLTTAEAAGVPITPVDPDPRIYLPAGLVVGLVLAALLALLLEWIDDRIYSTEVLSEATETSWVAAC